MRKVGKEVCMSLELYRLWRWQLGEKATSGLSESPQRDIF